MAGWDGIMTNLADQILPLLLFPFCVFLIFILHELGHYGAARLFGVRVISFDVGVGPRLWRKKDRNGTLWTLHLLPLCGLVRLAGEAHLTARPGEGAQTPDMFSARPLWQRALIVVAGPAMNLLLAALLLWSFFTFFGIPGARPVLAGVQMGTPAAEAGLLPGDQIVAMEGKKVAREQQIIRMMQARQDSDINFTIMRHGEKFDRILTPFEASCINERGFDCRRAHIGALILTQPVDLAAVQAVEGRAVTDPDRAYDILRRHAGQETRLLIAGPSGQAGEYKIIPDAESLAENHGYVSFHAMAELFYDRVHIGAALGEAVREAVRLTKGAAYVAVQMWPIDRDRFAMDAQVPRAQGWVAHDMYAVLYIAALLSVFVAFFNMLPLPWLDGGALVVLAVEAFAGQDKAHTIVPYITRSIILLFLALLAFANVGDFAHVTGLQ